MRGTILLTLLLLGLTHATSTLAHDGHHDDRHDQQLDHQVTVKRVVVRFLPRAELAGHCGKRALACAYTHAGVVLLPEDRAYGWTGTVVARVAVRWHSHRSLREQGCGRRVACVQGDVIHARNLDYNHRALAWLGEAYADYLGLEYNPRRMHLLAHELRHVLTGQGHQPG